MDPLGSMFHVRLFEAKNKVFQFDYQKMNEHVRVRLIFEKMVFDQSLNRNNEYQNL